MTFSASEREIMARVCTEKERVALELRYLGMSWRTIAMAQNCGRSTVVDRVKRAEQKLVIAIRQSPCV